MPSKILAATAVGCWVLAEAMAQGGILGLRGQELKPCTTGSKEEAECWSNIGLTRAVEAEGEPDQERKRALLLEAASAFAEALQLKPDWSGAANNLAQVYASLGRDAEAQRLFEKAVSSDTPLRPFYQRNYGDFLTRQGAWEQAAKQYRSAVAEARGDRQAHDSLVTILAQHSPEALLDYLSFLIGRGQALWAEEVALERLSESVSGEENFLTTLVTAQAEQLYLPEELPSRAADILKNLTSRSDIGEGAFEILRLYEGTGFNPSSYRWWAERGQASGGGGVSPRQAFRHLIRSLGDAEAKVEHFDLARKYFRLAVLLTREEPDLYSFRRLISLPLAEEDVATIDHLVDWNEAVMRQTGEKQDGLYLYRHDLGLLYSFFSRWDGEGPASGIYQLSRATQMGGVGPPDGPPETPTFDARIYTRLAAGYTETGRPEQARRTLVSLVDAYRFHGLGAEADALELILNPGQGRRRLPDRRPKAAVYEPRYQDFTNQPPQRPPQ